MHPTPKSNPNLPLPGFIHSMQTLLDHPADLPTLKPAAAEALTTLRELQRACDELPDLSGERWFLEAQWLAARERTLQQLDLAVHRVRDLSMVIKETQDSLGLHAWCRAFLQFAKNAVLHPASFQQLCSPPPALRLPAPVIPPADTSESSLFRALLDNALQ